MRGRYDTNGKVKQNIEVNNEEAVNALTTVQKDSLVIEMKNIKKQYTD